MAIVFPKTPYLGIKFSVGDAVWTWDGVAWNLLKSEEESLKLLRLIPGSEPTTLISNGYLAIANGSDWNPGGNGDILLMVYLDGEWKEVNVGESYVLPTASTTVLGGIKVDGTTVVINNGVISALEGGTIALTNSFETISVSGQSNIVAESESDTLTLEAGSGISITTNPSTDTITITNTGSGSNTFGTIAVSGQSNVVADSTSDILTLVAGSGISIITDASNDSITILNTVSLSSINFTSLNEPSTSGLTIDQFYLPAITMLTVTNSGAVAYRFDQYGTTNNPTVYAINGTTIAFKLNIPGHPFLIQTGAGVNYNTGLIHVSSTGVVSSGSSAQGQTSGTLYWKIPTDITGGYRYQCSAHAPMVGSITIKNFATI
jgi:plastocyanin